MSDTEKLDALLAAYKQAEAELYSILNHFDRRGLLPDNVTPQDVQEAVALLFERLDKQDRILAALREPSVNLQAAAYAAFEAHDDMEAALRAAVAAAEQEVGRE